MTVIKLNYIPTFRTSFPTHSQRAKTT